MNRILSMRLLVSLSLALLLGLTQPSAFAAGQDAEAPAAAESAVPDPLKRETPRSMVSGLLGALGQSDYDRTALYFDLPPATSSRQRTNAVEQARAFHAVLDDGGTLDTFIALSNDPNGKVSDDLPVDQERVGEIAIQDKKIPVLLTKGQDGEHQVWRVSRETLTQITAATKRAPVVTEPAADQVVVAGAPLKYRALLLGIEMATAHGAEHLDLVGDSELIVRQVEGRYKVKDATMRELHAEVKRALAGLDSWTIRHVRRESNAEADRLVNAALDGA